MDLKHDQKSDVSTNGEHQDPQLVADGANKDIGESDKGQVAYSTYKKVTSANRTLREERDRLETELKEIREKEKEIEQKRLEEQGNYKKLLEQERERLKQIESDKKAYENELLTVHKLSAFKEKLPGTIGNPEYYEHVDIDSIVINPETNTIDDTSVQSVVDKFLEKHHRLIDTKKGTLPDHAPQNKSTLTYDAWLKLPIKEKKARYNEVFNKG